VTPPCLTWSRHCGCLVIERIRQDGSHIRVTTQLNGEDHVTVPNHASLRLGTFRSILKLVAAHHRLTVEELLEKLDL